MKKQVLILIVSLLMVAGKVAGQCNVVITNPSPVCSPGTVDLSAAEVTDGSDTGLTYTYWTNVGATTPLSNYTAVAISGTYYIMGDDGAGCTEVEPVTVTINPLPTATAGNNGPVCKGNLLTLTGGANGLSSYSWSGPDSFTSTTQSPTVSTSATVAMAGIYTITVIDGNGCVKTATTTVVVNNLDAPTATATNDGPVCVGGTLTLTGGADGLSTYTWSGPNSFSTTDQSPIVSTDVSSAMAGVYILTVTAADGCANTATTNVTVNALPLASANNSGPVCIGTALSLTGGPDLMTSYSWSGPDGFSSTDQSPSVSGSATSAMAGTYTLTVVDANTCTNTATTTVTVNSLPTATAGNNGPVCVGTSLDLTGGPDLMTSYSWSGPDGFSSTEQNPSVSGSATSAMAGIYTLTIVDGNGCTDTETTTVIVNSLPAVTAFNNGPVCIGSALSLTGGPGSMTTYTWSGPDSFASSAQSPTVSANATSGMAGTYTLTVVDANTCSNSTTTNVVINPIPVPTISGPNPVCIGSTGNVYTTESGKSVYDWTISAGGLITSGGDGSNTVTITWNNSGAQTVRVTYTSNGCPAEAATVYNVTVQPNNAANVAFTGSLTLGGKLTATYDFDSPECFPDDRTLTKYIWEKSSHDDQDPYSNYDTNIGDSTVTLTGVLGYYIRVSVQIWDGSVYKTAVVGPWSLSKVAANSKPVASAIDIEGTPLVNETLTGIYTYTDAENDPASTPGYQWFRALAADGVARGKITGATSSTYKLTAADAGKYIGLKVVPKSSTGTSPGDTATMLAPWFGQVVANAPVASNVKILGTPHSGMTLYGSYSFYDAENDPENGSSYEWYYSDDAAGLVGLNTILSADQISYKIPDTYIDKYIGFSVTPATLASPSPGSKETTPVFVGKVTNDAPVASSASVSGPTKFNVDDILTANYIYSDFEGDLQGISAIEWWRSSDDVLTGADFQIIVGTSINYKLTSLDTGKYIFSKITPKAVSGTLEGSIVPSAPTGKRVNTPPYAVKQPITGTIAVGQLLTGHYEYHDRDGDAQGASTYRWLREGVPISGATNITYTVDLDDEGKNLAFEVTPIASAGYLTGLAVLSTSVGPVPASGIIPLASEVCIQGIRAENEWLTGKYKFTFGNKSDASTYRWLRGSTVLGTNITYQLNASDISSTDDIRFEVTPKAVNPDKSGPAATSLPLARIIIPQDSYSSLIDTVFLDASVHGGVYSGPGVTNGIFSPRSVGDSIDPYRIYYNYDTINASTICTQQAFKDITVTPGGTYFEGFENDPVIFACQEGGLIKIRVMGVADTTNTPYYNESYGWYIYTYGYWDYYINQNAIVGGYGQRGKWTIFIDPRYLNPGKYIDELWFYFYKDGYWSYIYKPFEIEKVGEIVTIKNLDPAYCREDLKYNISVEGLSPVGGTSHWTGAPILTDIVGETAKINPISGTANTTYSITYQYETQNHCWSEEVIRPVTINPLPVSEFTVDRYCNIEGGPRTLTPQVPLGSGSTGTFIGSGVIGDKFYPDIAGEGSYDIKYTVIDANYCTTNKINPTTVRKVEGEYVDLPPIICYRDTTYNISVTDLPSGIEILNFKNVKNSLVWTTGSTAQYDVTAARAGYDTVKFSYKWDEVVYTLRQAVFIDSIGRIQITGLKSDYCDYEGTATTRALIENSTGNGTFSFTGPSAAFTKYPEYSIFDPTKTTTGIQYEIRYTHVSTVNNSGCRKTESDTIIVNESPSVNIVNTRTTINIKEPPITLNGSPADGTFTGRGVYKSGNDFVFDPLVAGLGDAEFALSYTNSEGCSATIKDTMIVAAASGSITGINANNQYCYDGLKDTLTYTSSKPWFNGSFSGAGITNTASAKAVFDPAGAGKGDHNLVFTYYDQYNTEFEISATVNVDSLGVVEIKPLAAGDEYCNNVAPFELITTPRGGVFTGPVTAGNLNPSKALGDTAVTYTYLNVRTGCSITGRVPFTIHPAPLVSFTTSDICIENETDSIRFINSSTSADAISSWLWSFSDIGGTDLSSKQAPAYVFKSGGQHLITLTATTINNCAVKKDVTVDLGVKPIGDFYWTNECFVPGDSIMLFDTTFSTSAIVSRSWNFFDGRPLKTGTKLKYPKNAVGVIPVQYIVNTAYANCSDTVTKNVYIRPNIVLSADGYFEDFESGNGGWSRGDESLNSWSFGTPDRNTIKSAASGAAAWFTRFDSTLIESSSVISPCFDFKGINRPMVSVGIRRNFSDENDGAALQYRIGDAVTWNYVGTLNDGINWYNSVLIDGKPGGSQVGWTSKVADPTWIEARHTVDELKGKKDVKFRIAYGSNGRAKKSEGIAFDDIFIGERKRNVLLEHFANTSSTTSSEATAMINEVDLAIDKDVVNIQYHTNFPGIDSFYVENPADASARILFYGLTKAPYSFVDGGTRKDYSSIFDYSTREFDGKLTPINRNEVIRRGLITPVFDIRLDSLNVSGGVLTISGNIVAFDDTTLSNLTLYLAVIEKTNSKHSGAAGETLFRNVFRKFVPDAAGINLGKTWSKGVAVPIQDQTWIISKTLNSSDIEVVAFIQNSVTKEVYQAASMLKPKITVGIEKTGIMDNIDYMLYPNPAKHQLTIRFGETLEDDTDIFIYDFGGTIVRTYKTGSGESEFVIDDLGLKDGIYLIRVSSGGVNYGFRKLIISGS